MILLRIWFLLALYHAGNISRVEKSYSMRVQDAFVYGTSETHNVATLHEQEYILFSTLFFIGQFKWK